MNKLREFFPSKTDIIKKAFVCLDDIYLDYISELKISEKNSNPDYQWNAEEIKKDLISIYIDYKEIRKTTGTVIPFRTLTKLRKYEDSLDLLLCLFEKCERGYFFNKAFGGIKAIKELPQQYEEDCVGFYDKTKSVQSESVSKKEYNKVGKLLSINTIFDILNDIFAQTPFYNDFLYFYRDRYSKVNLTGKPHYDYFAYSVAIPIVNKGYISASNSCSALTVCNLAHEYGHLISFKNNYTTRTFPPLDEIESTFFELIAYDYCVETLNNPDAKNLAYYNLISDVNRNRDIVFAYGLSKRVSSVKAIIEYLKGQKLSLINTYKKLDKTMDLQPDSINYNISLMVAIELFEIYKADPKEAFKLIREIGNIEDQRHQLDRIKDLGVNMNANTQQFCLRWENTYKKNQL